MDAKRSKLYASFFLKSLDERICSCKKSMKNNLKRPQRKGACMWFVTDNINSHSIEWELIMFINIKVLRLHSTDWKSPLIVVLSTA